MPNEDVPIVGEKIVFIGAVIASISHELKNALATANETAGLLTDILKGSGGPAGEEDEIRRCAEDIAQELDRAFLIIRNLNTFAHLADHPIAEFDSVGLLELVVTLAGYKSFAGRARLVGAETAPMNTSPLLLADLLYGVLVSAYSAAGRDAGVTVSVRAVGTETEFRVSIEGHPDLGDLIPDSTATLLEALRGSVILDEGGQITLLLPTLLDEPGVTDVK